MKKARVNTADEEYPPPANSDKCSKAATTIQNAVVATLLFLRLKSRFNLLCFSDAPTVSTRFSRAAQVKLNARSMPVVGAHVTLASVCLQYSGKDVGPYLLLAFLN